ncbi:MAG: hypothetical protein K6F09_06615 [Clostridiales bacterium]|nr:hypothetical protein [Clostridiales bacterium]
MSVLFFGKPKYRVDYGNDKSLFTNAKDKYSVGADVKLYFDKIATDTSYYFYLDGKEISLTYDDKTGFCINFEMPSHDVKLTVGSRNISAADEGSIFKSEEVLKFHSFDGGGPEYSVTVDDPSVASCTSERRYQKKDHEELDGAGYDVIFTVKGLKEGETTMTVSSFSPIVESEEIHYLITVNSALKISVRQTETITSEEAPEVEEEISEKEDL